MPPRSRRLAHLEALADAALPEIDTSWTKHPDVQPILDELRAIPLPPMPPCDNPLRESTEVIRTALANPQIRKLMCKLASVMCTPTFPKTWIPTFGKTRR